mmetsp:Transcript_22167/g.37996  ORF Transcript_22167/g.37996 Transcript_22167/m.37996 type:complete len:83 (+) Transcript_22167:1589-1837(+)
MLLEKKDKSLTDWLRFAERIIFTKKPFEHRYYCKAVQVKRGYGYCYLGRGKRRAKFLMMYEFCPAVELGLFAVVVVRIIINY